jgi:hypothetical protein
MAGGGIKTLAAVQKYYNTTWNLIGICHYYPIKK